MSKDYCEILLEAIDTIQQKALMDVTGHAGRTEVNVDPETLLIETNPFAAMLQQEKMSIGSSIILNGNTATKMFEWTISNQSKYDLCGLECEITAAATTIEKDQSYGVQLTMQASNKCYIVQLDSSEMLGNPATFASMLQKKVFDLADVGNISSIGVKFYNNTSGNITFNNVNIIIGYNLETFDKDDEPLIIYGEDAELKYRTNEYGEIVDGGSEVLCARWIYQDQETYRGVTFNNPDDLPAGTEIRWYRYSEASPEGDEYGGAYWVYQPFTPDEQNQGYNKFRRYFSDFNPQTDSEQFKAVIVQGSPATSTFLVFTSKIITIENIKEAEVEALTSRSINLLDGTGGIYPYYSYDQLIIEDYAFQSLVERTATLSYQSVYSPKELLKRIQSVEWKLPEGHFYFAENYGDIISDEEGHACVFKTISNNTKLTEEEKLKELFTCKYTISENRIPNSIADKIQCIVTLDHNKSYLFEKEALLTIPGSGGTDNAVVVRLVDGVGRRRSAIMAKEELYLRINVYDADGNDITSSTTISQAPLDWAEEDKFTISTETNGLFSIETKGCNYPIGLKFTINIATIAQEENTEGTGSENTQRDLNIIEYVVLPITTDKAYEYQGPTTFLYDSSGVLCAGQGAEIKLYNRINKQKISNISAESGIVYFDNAQINELWWPTLKDNVLIPNPYYDQACDIEKGCFYITLNNGTWIQPITIAQRRYFSRIINEWDGSLKIDEAGNYILAASYVAGKKNSDNTFTGAILGELGKISDEENAKNKKEIGLFGYDNGSQSFGFRANGSAFLGKSGGGRILFDGDKGQIYSAKFDGWAKDENDQPVIGTLNTTATKEDGSIDYGEEGTYIDLDNGKLITNDGYFRGHIEATSGKIGNLTINEVANKNEVDNLDKKLDNQITEQQNYINSIVSELQNQIDGTITSWFDEGIPLPYLDGDNIIKTPPQQSDKDYTQKPANEWTTLEDKKHHAGDLYYDKSTGFCYRWLYEEKDNTPTYYWIRITDSDITNALAAADKAQRTADGKVNSFVTENNGLPVPPYQVGDMWINATYTDNNGKSYKNALLYCTTKKEEGGEANISDWALAADYLANEDFIAFKNDYTNFTNSIQSQVDNKADTYYQSTDPSDDWTTLEEQEKHVGDLWRCTAKIKDDSHNVIRKENSEWVWIQEKTINDYEFDVIIYKMPNQDTTNYINWNKERFYSSDQLQSESKIFNFYYYYNNQWNEVKEVYCSTFVRELIFNGMGSWDQKYYVEAVDCYWYYNNEDNTWYINGPSNVKMYDWHHMEIPDNIFDAYDGKSSIFAQDSPPQTFKKNDTWILTASWSTYNTGTMLTATADSNGDNDRSKWAEKVKYTDDTAIDNLGYNNKNLARLNILSGYANVSSDWKYTVKFQGQYEGLKIDKSIFENNKKYVLSYKFKDISGNPTEYIAGHSLGFSTIKAIVDGTEYTTSYADGYEIDENIQEHTVEVYLVKDQAYPADLYIQSQRVPEDKNYNSTIEIWDLKLEKGDRATPWEPAPEDTQNQIITLTGEVSNGEGIFLQGLSNSLTADNAKKYNFHASSMFIGTLQKNGNYSKIFSVEPTYENNTLTGGVVYLAGWTVTENQLSYGTLGSAGSFGIYPQGTTSVSNAFTLDSGDNWVLTAGNTFGITANGKLYAKSAYIEGEIHATSGEFSGDIKGDSTISIGGTDDQPSFKVYSNGDVTLNGNITWGTGTSPTQVVYTQVSSPSKPTDGTAYSNFPPNSTAAWHQTFNSGADKFASYTYDGGNTWGNPIQIVGEQGPSGTPGATIGIFRSNEQSITTNELQRWSSASTDTWYMLEKPVDNQKNNLAVGDPFYAQVHCSDDGRDYAILLYVREKPVGEKEENYTYNQDTGEWKIYTKNASGYFPIGHTGAPGTSVTVESIQYARGNSATQPPNTGWKDNISDVTTNGTYPYLWVKTTYSNGQATTICAKNYVTKDEIWGGLGEEDAIYKAPDNTIKIRATGIISGALQVGGEAGNPDTALFYAGLDSPHEVRIGAWNVGTVQSKNGLKWGGSFTQALWSTTATKDNEGYYVILRGSQVSDNWAFGVAKEEKQTDGSFKRVEVFSIKHNGDLYAKNADITGTLKSGPGSSLGSWQVSSPNGYVFGSLLKKIVNGTTTQYGIGFDTNALGSTKRAFAIGILEGIGEKSSWADADFYITGQGKVVANNIEIKGGNIKVGNNFSVDTDGNLTAANCNLNGFNFVTYTINSTNSYNSFTSSDKNFRLRTRSNEAVMEFTDKCRIVLNDNMTILDTRLCVAKSTKIAYGSAYSRLGFGYKPLGESSLIQETYHVGIMFDKQSNYKTCNPHGTVFMFIDEFGRLRANTATYCVAEDQSKELADTNSLKERDDHLRYKGSLYIDGNFYINGNPVSGSDARIKNSISCLDERYSILFDLLKPSQFKYNDGTSERIHTGFIVQDILAGLEKAGLTTQEFAAVCSNNKENSNAYWGIRYGELVSLNTWQIQKLKPRMTAAEKEIASLKLEVQQLRTELEKFKQ